MEFLKIHQIPCLQDNYAYLINDPAANITAAIDTPDVAAIERGLKETGWNLDYILNTHHHRDHAGGNLALKRKTACKIYGAGADADRLPGIDKHVAEGDVFYLGGLRARVLETPGHTRAHICWVFEDEHVVFVGDTLFSMGCGRLFEGTAEQMWQSLQKLMALPDETRVYCAHEYTQANGRFAQTLEAHNPDLQARMKEVERLRKAGRPTVPTTIGLEKRTNPFLRPASPELREALGMNGADDVAVFAATRRRKDEFRG